MWPKTINVGNITIPVDSMVELDEIIKRYGGHVAAQTDHQHAGRAGKKTSDGSLAMTDRVMLKQFVDRGTKGVLNKDLGKFLAARGKAIGPALRKWSVKTGLTQHEKADAFERFNRPDGRGYRLSETSMRIAETVLREQ